MNRSLTALFAALEAVLVVGIGVGIPLVPLTALWAFQYGLQLDWQIFWRTAADIWLLGSGVDLTMTLTASLAASFGFPAAAAPFALTIAPLGFALVTALLGVRAGRRIAETPHRIIGIASALVVFASLSVGIALSALIPSAKPTLWQAAVLPTLVFGIGLVVGIVASQESGAVANKSVAASTALIADRPLVAGRPDIAGRPWSLASRRRGIIQRWMRIHPRARVSIASAIRTGIASAMGVLGVASVIVALAFLGSYAKIIALYEAIHAGVLGGIALTAAQLAFVPNLVVWAASWLVGPGFSIGTASSVSPLGTTLGPIPALPILGALPNGSGDWGFLGIAAPVLLAFAIALVARRRLVARLGAGDTLPWLILAGVLSGVVGGVLLGLIAWASAGSAGPGRLADVGPDPISVGCISAIEFAIAAVIGLLAGRQGFAANHVDRARAHHDSQ